MDEPEPDASSEPPRIVERIDPGAGTEPAPASEPHDPRGQRPNRLLLAADNLPALRCLLAEHDPQSGAPR
jgi:hypothetical protein